MALRGRGKGRPDHTKQSVGNEGDVMDQEPESGKQVYRKGAPEADADIDVGTKDSPKDLTDGDFESGSRNAGGAEALAGNLVDDDGNTFDIEIDWLNDDGDVVRTEARSALTGVIDVRFNIAMRSDRFEVRLIDSGGASKVHGSVNAH